VEFKVRDLPRLLRAPVGRQRLLLGLQQSAYPVLRAAAALRRRVVTPQVRVVVVIGSYGKTTTARAVTAALGLPANPAIEYNSSIGVAANLSRIHRRDRHAVIEVGISHPGEMRGYASMVRPDTVVVTSIGSEHNRSLGSLAQIREEKAAMVRALPPEGVAVLNADDDNVMWMARQARAKVISFGTGAGADVAAVGAEVDWPGGMRFTLDLAGTRRTVRSRLLGKHSIGALLAAAAVAWQEGVDLDDVVAALEGFAPTPGRMQVVPLPGGAWLVRDDFKSSLETIERALSTLAELPARRRVAVLGEVSEPPGSQGEIYRGLGERLAASADAAVFVGGNYQRWASGAAAAGMSRADLVDAGRDVLRAAEAARDLTGPGDVVLVKGRDTQRLDRVSLALMGRQVACTISTCSLRTVRCERCPMLESGWKGGRGVS